MKLLCFNPHNDDTIIGAGGTVIKLLRKGWKIGYVYITDGRYGSDILTPEETEKIRAEEAKKERKILGIENFWNMEIEDGTLEKLSAGEIESLEKKILTIISDFSPDFILIPSLSELHPDHRSTHNIVYNLVKSNKLEIPVLKYLVWSLPDFFKKNYDLAEKAIIVNIDKEFEDKIKILKLHSSQDSEGRYTKIVYHFNSYISLVFKTYKNLDFDKSEIIGIFNLLEKNKVSLENLLKDLENPTDVTIMFHGRQEKKIKAQLGDDFG
ncbi:MAG: PIG-L family deacetylase [Candidatus Aenigmarchaeota archaeon]|nr:PIG-L family deacetylase [Candidatus Aenigmarchaeota archaeon]